MVAKRNAYGVLVQKPGGKRPFGRQRLIQKDNIKMSLKTRMGVD